METKVHGNLEADTLLLVCNETDYLIGIRVLQTDHRCRAKANWINEKLVYFQWWWDQVLGGYLILDVESEQILQKEFIHDGGTAFEQFQEAKRNGLIPREDHTHQEGQREGRVPSK